MKTFKQYLIENLKPYKPIDKVVKTIKYKGILITVEQKKNKKFRVSNNYSSKNDYSMQVDIDLEFNTIDKAIEHEKKIILDILKGKIF